MSNMLRGKPYSCRCCTTKGYETDKYTSWRAKEKEEVRQELESVLEDFYGEDA